MADVGILGLQVDASGALTQIDGFNRKLAETATASDKAVPAAERVESGLQKATREYLAQQHRIEEWKNMAGQGTGAITAVIHAQEQLEAALRHTTAAEAAAERESREHQKSLAPWTAVYERRAAAAQKAAAAEEAALRKRTLEEIRAIEMDRRFEATQDAITKAGDGSNAMLGRLRPGLTALATQITATNGPANALLSTLASFGVGNAVVVGAIAGVTAMVAVHDRLTQKLQAERKAQDEAIQSLERWIALQKQGAAGSVGAELDKLRDRLEADRRALEAARQAATPGSGPQGLATDSGERLRAAQAEYDRLAALVGAGEQRVNAIEQRAAADNLAALATSNQLWGAERARAILLLEGDRKKLAELNKAAASTFVPSDQSVAARRDLIDQIDQLNKALYPVDKAAERADKAAAKLETTFGRMADAAALEVAHQRALNAAFGQGSDVIAEINALYELKAKYAAIDAEFSGRQAAALKSLADDQYAAAKAGRAQVAAEDALHKSWREAYADAANRRAAAAEQLTAQDKIYASFLRYAEAIKHQPSGIHLVSDFSHVGDFADGLSRGLGAAQGLLAVFGGLNKEIRDAVGEAANLASSISHAQQAGVFTDIAGKQQNVGFMGALTGAAGIGGQANAITSALAIAGAAISIGESLGKMFGLFADHAKEARDAQIAYTDALSDFAITSRTTAEQALKDNIDRATALIPTAAKAAGVSLSGYDVTSLSDLQHLIDTLGRGPGLGDLRTQLRRLVEQAIANAADIEKQNAKQLAAFIGSNDVLELRTRGLGAEADALQTQLEIQAKVDDAMGRFGNTAEVARYKTLLLADAQQKLSDAEAERAKQAAAERERVNRSLFDLTNGARAFTDPRGASDAAFDEMQRRRYADAATAVEQFAVQVFNAAEALDRFTQQALKEAADGRTYLARIATASGDTRFGEDITRLNGQIAERQQGARDGISPLNQLLQDRAQYAENSLVQMNRAIEDGTAKLQAEAKRQTDAVDEQIRLTNLAAAASAKQFDDQITEAKKKATDDARFYDDQIGLARDSVKAQLAALDQQGEYYRQAQQTAQGQLQAAQQNVAATTRVVEALGNYADSLKLSDLSTLSPAEKLAEARAQFEALASQAFGGNRDAAGGIPAAITALLQQSRVVNASGVGYTGDNTRATDVLAQLQQKYGAQLGTEHSALGQAQSAVAQAEAQLSALQATRDAVTASGDAQIQQLQALKDAAATDNAQQIDMLQQFKDAAAQGFRDELDRLGLVKDAIGTALDANTQTLIANEQAAHAERLAFGDWRERLYKEQTDATSYLQQLVEKYSGISTAFGPVGGEIVSEQEPPKFITPTRDVDSAAALKEQNATLRLQVEELQAQTVELRAHTVELKAAVKLGVEAARQAKGSADAIMETIRDTTRSTKSAVENAVYNVRR